MGELHHGQARALVEVAAAGIAQRIGRLAIDALVRGRAAEDEALVGLVRLERPVAEAERARDGQAAGDDLQRITGERGDQRLPLGRGQDAAEGVEAALMTALAEQLARDLDRLRLLVLDDVERTVGAVAVVVGEVLRHHHAEGLDQASAVAAHRGQEVAQTAHYLLDVILVQPLEGLGQGAHDVFFGHAEGGLGLTRGRYLEHALVGAGGDALDLAALDRAEREAVRGLGRGRDVACGERIGRVLAPDVRAVLLAPRVAVVQIASRGRAAVRTHVQNELAVPHGGEDGGGEIESLLRARRRDRTDERVEELGACFVGALGAHLDAAIRPNCIIDRLVEEQVVVMAVIDHRAAGDEGEVMLFEPRKVFVHQFLHGSGL